MVVEVIYAQGHEAVRLYLDGVKPRLERAMAKNPPFYTTVDDVIDLVYARNRILGAVFVDGVVRGGLILVFSDDALRGTRSLVVELAALDNVPGLFEAVQGELEDLAAMERVDSLSLNVSRPGWAKRMKMAGKSGYNVACVTVEKRYGRE